MAYIGRTHPSSASSSRQPVFNFNRPHGFDSTARAEMRRRAETLEHQIYSGQFSDYLESLGVDEQTYEIEMDKAKEILAVRQQAADMDER